jgi:hypothetical protein
MPVEFAPTSEAPSTAAARELAGRLTDETHSSLCALTGSVSSLISFVVSSKLTWFWRTAVGIALSRAEKSNTVKSKRLQKHETLQMF